MNTQILEQIKVGTKIEFKACTRWSNKKETRIVNGFTKKGLPTIRFGGWSDFVLNEKEIIRIIK